MSQAAKKSDEPDDFLANACQRAGLGSAFLEGLVRLLGDELYRDRYAQLERTGAAKEDGIPLAKVFVDLSVSRRIPGDDTAHGDFLLVHHLSTTAFRATSDSAGDAPKQVSGAGDLSLKGALQSDARPAHCGYVLIGGPGQGKSTLCQLLCQVHRAWLLHRHTAQLREEARRLVEEIVRPGTGYARPVELRFPLAIVMPEAAAWLAMHPPREEEGSSPRPPRLLAFLEDKARKRGSPIAASSFLAILRSSDWLLVLDGLDEVPVTAGRDSLLREIEALLEALACADSHGLVIATTRPQGYSGELRGMVSDEALHLVPLDLPKALRYAERLADTRYSTTPEQREKVVSRLKQAAEQPTTARLMRTPLQVTILAALVDSVGRAPGERWSLFSEYYRVAYDRERERFEGSPATRDIAEVLRHYRRHIDKVHAQVALLLHVEGEHAGRTEATLSIERFTQVVDAVLAEDEIDAARRAELAAQLRRAVTERLVLLSERSPGQVRFDVRAMQEFFTANALAARGEDLLQRRVLQAARATSFRQVLLFLASKAFAELSDLRDFFAGPLCDHLDDDPDVLSRATRPGAVLALEILEDGAAIKQTKYVRRLTERATALLDRPPHKVQVRLATAALLDADAEADMQPVLEAAIAARLRGRPPVDRLGAWVALLALVTRDVKWATALADGGWGEMRGAYKDVLRAVWRAEEPVGAWVQSRLSSYLDDVSPEDIRLPTEAPARAAMLASLWQHLPRDQWEDRETTREAAVSALQRTSGLDDARVWDQLQFSLPRPEIPRADGRASDRPDPRPVHIDAIRFQNLRIFADLKMTPARPHNGDGQWIVIVGANGRGKTTLLRGVALALVDVISQPNRLPPRAFEMTWRRLDTPAQSPVSLSVEANGQTYSAQFTYDEDRGGQQRFHQLTDSDRGALAPVFGYGCRRGSALGGARRQIEDEPGTELYTLFDEALDLTHAETWLTFREIDALKEKGRDPDGPANRVYRAIQTAFRDVFGMELLGNRGQQVFVRGEHIGEMPIGALSDGYLTMMGWIVDLLAKWIRRRRSFEQIQEGFTRTMTGLVLIDEIDLHIHPAWQKDIIHKVRGFFPKMSFIVTTHNPFTLLGARAEEIWVLRPDSDGLIRAHRGTEQPALLTAAAIYEAYFENPRDFPHRVGADFHRYERLAASPIRSDDEEAEVQALLTDLRRAGFDPGWEPVPREELPPYPGDEEDGAGGERST